MMTQKFRESFEKYHKRKWFPDRYPDPHEEFVDYISEEMIRDLLSESTLGSLGAAYYLLRLLPALKFPELFKEFSSAISERLNGQILPRDIFYFIRSNPENESRELWKELERWAEKWETVLSDWLHAQQSVYNSFPQAQDALTKIGSLPDQTSLENNLTATRDLFSFELGTRISVSSMVDLLRYFRLSQCDTVAGWNDFTAFGKAVIENAGVERSPSFRKSETSDAAQFLFPIEPPVNVILEYGKAAGPMDSLRFLHELGQGFFYCGINPELPIEQRICGDPALPEFWGFIYSFLLADQVCLNRLIGPQSEGLSPEFRLILEFWYRYDSVLAVFKSKTASRFAEAQDIYVAIFEKALGFSPPHFLYLYDLARASEAAFRSVALQNAAAAVERFRELYGKQWFTSRRFSERMREYWWAGFAITMRDVLQDLGVPEVTGYPFMTK